MQHCHRDSQYDYQAIELSKHACPRTFWCFWTFRMPQTHSLTDSMMRTKFMATETTVLRITRRVKNLYLWEMSCFPLPTMFGTFCWSSFFLHNINNMILCKSWRLVEINLIHDFLIFSYGLKAIFMKISDWFFMKIIFLFSFLSCI